LPGVVKEGGLGITPVEHCLTLRNTGLGERCLVGIRCSPQPRQCQRRIDAHQRQGPDGGPQWNWYPSLFLPQNNRGWSFAFATTGASAISATVAFQSFA